MEITKSYLPFIPQMCQSLFVGETTYNLSDVNAMRGRIGKLAEGIDLLSKQIAAFPADPGSRHAKLQNAIRQAAAHYIKVSPKYRSLDSRLLINTGVGHTTQGCQFVGSSSIRGDFQLI